MLQDSPETIAKKIKKAKTDSVEGGVLAEMMLASGGSYPSAEVGTTPSNDIDCDASALKWVSEVRPEAANLLGLYGLATGLSPEQVGRDVDGLNWGSFKARLIDAMVEELTPGVF